MDLNNNILPMQLPGAPLPQHAQGANGSQGTPAGGLLAFLQTLGTINTDQSVAEKIAAILDDQGLSPQEKLKAVKDILPNLGALVSQKHAETANATLTSDLSANLAAGLQGDQAVLDQLAGQFQALGDAPTDEQVAAFKEDAVDSLRKTGCDDATIQKYLVSLSSLLGDKITLAQAAELAMPLPGQKPVVEFAASDSASAIEPAAGELAATPQEFALQQLSRAAKAPAKPVLPEARMEAAQKPLPDAVGLKELPKQSSGEPAPQAKPFNPALVNMMAEESGTGANNNGFGQQPQNAYGVTLMRGPDALQAQNLVNTMPAVNNSATTQMVALQIQRNAAAKVDTFTMQLDPMNLGRLEVKMKFTRDGALKAQMIAEKPETLSMLQKDALQLQRILQQAGLDVDDSALSFDLRQNNGQDQQNLKESYNNGAGNSHGAPAAGGIETAAVKMAVEAMGYISQGGVNIVV